MKKLKLIGAAAVVVSVALLAGFRMFSPPAVAYVTPEHGRVSEEIYGTGTVEARVVSTAGSKITGRIKKLHADHGDFVRKGSVLAELESGDLAALAQNADDLRRKGSSNVLSAVEAVARAKASLKAADAALARSAASAELARRTLERYEALSAEGLVPGQALDEKRASLDEAMRQRDLMEAERSVAETEIRRSEHALEAARHEERAASSSWDAARARLADAVVTAAIDGVVVSREAEVGNTVVPGSPIFRIADPSTVWVKANIDEAKGGAIVAGSEARIILRSDKGRALTGKVARIGRVSDRVTEEMEVDVSFAAVDASRFRLGEQAEVFIKGRDADGLTIPSGALTVRDGKEGVFRAVGGRATFTRITTGVWGDKLVQVIDGLSPGDMVILPDAKAGRAIVEGKRIRLPGSGR
ncbi:MAG: efflux RND transporter periplasmic adaptor subunit [Nitrospirae bacterium]|nr:efflux RND transporter periplasmic adaptor subunit [Nitrospirota bacterium]